MDRKASDIYRVAESHSGEFPTSQFGWKCEDSSESKPQQTLVKSRKLVSRVTMSNYMKNYTALQT